MPAFKYEWQQRVFVPGMKQVQGSIVEVRCHAFRGNSYLVAWHEVSSAGIEIKEQVFTELSLDEEQPKPTVDPIIARDFPDMPTTFRQPGRTIKFPKSIRTKRRAKR